MTEKVLDHLGTETLNGIETQDRSCPLVLQRSWVSTWMLRALHSLPVHDPTYSGQVSAILAGFCVHDLNPRAIMPAHGVVFPVS
jgi:hypothetical protein